MKEQVRAAVEAIVRDVTAAAGLEIFQLAIVPNRRIDLVVERRTGGVLLEEVARTHKKISRELEARGHDWEAYTIELSTPGVNRLLRSPAEFPRFHGQRIKVRLKDGPEAERNCIGYLESSDAAGFAMTLDDGRETTIPFDRVAAAHLEPQLPF